MRKNLLNTLTLVILAIATLMAMTGFGFTPVSVNADSRYATAEPDKQQESSSPVPGAPAITTPAPDPNAVSQTPMPAPDTSSSPAPASTPDASSASTPKPSPLPTLNPTPTPASTPKPTQSPATTLQPTPTPTSTPKPLPTPSPTPKPTPPPAPASTPVPAPSGKVVAGYYGGWAAFSGYTPDKIPAASLTHLDYAFAKIGSDMRITVDDPTIDPENLSVLSKLKNTNPNLKILISVGGWNDSGRFSDMAASDTNRSIFADSVVDFILKYHLDGVDIDWEYPVSGGQPTNSSSPDDKRNYTLLLATLREKLNAQGASDGRHYWLTIAGSAGSFYARNTELSKIHAYIDYALIMTYDIHGNWDAYTDFNAPLYTPSESTPQFKWSGDSAVRMYENAGFPASKIVLGIPFYGYVYNGVSNANNGLYQSFSSGTTLSYDKIESTYAADPAFKQYASSAEEPWLFNGSTFINFEDEASIALKSGYIKTHALAGAGIWEISQNRDGTLLKSVYQTLR